jgi:predicted ATPase/DNA-binding NarL/FixJ family response regulator
MRRDLVSPLFIGRGAELATLTAALEAAITGTPTVVLLGGEAGVGKTRLVEEAAERARAAGARVLAGSCIELGGEGLPFGPLAHAFRTLMRDTPPDELDALLGPARSEFARVLPDLDPSAALSRAPLAEGGTGRLLELALGVIERVAEDRPLMFVIEDLHWADRSTLDLVALLVRALRAGSVLVVVSFRTDELHRSHPLRPLVTGWERVRTVHRIELERFGRDDVERQLAAILDAPPGAWLVDLVHERSEGNAFLVEEILGAVQSGADPDHLPLSLRDVLLTRVERLSPAAQRLLRIAAAAGPSVSDRLLAAVAGLGDDELDEALREGLEHHVLVADGTAGGYVFRHALTRDAVYGDTLARERARIHAAYGEALAADPALAGSDVSVPALLALHWTASHDLPRALEASVEAAGLAAPYAPAEALRHLERALELWPQVPDAPARTGMDIVEALRRAGTSAYAAGELDRTLALFGEALAELEPGADPERRALLMEGRAAALFDAARDDEAQRELERAAALLPDEARTEARAVVLSSLAATRVVAGDFAGGRAAAEEAVAAAREIGGASREAIARMMLGVCLGYLDEGPLAVAELEAAVALAETAGDHAMALRGHLNLSDALQNLGRSRDAAAVAEQGIELAARVGLTRSVYGSLVTINCAEARFHLGDWDAAARLLTRAADNELAPAYASLVLDHRARIAVLAGRYEDATVDLDGSRRLAADRRGDQYSFARTMATAEMARAQGDSQMAREEVRRAVAHEVTEPVPRYSWQLVWLGLRVEAEASEPAADRVAALTGLAAELAATTPPTQAYRALAAAEVAREPDWTAAVAACRAADDPYLLAYALLRAAAADCAAGDRETAAPALEEAARLAGALGAAPLLDDVRALARRARVELAEGDVEPAGPGIEAFGLTQREREVLDLLADGRSNQQIAEELFITRKTASVHVSNILGKLGVASRGEATAMAHRLKAPGTPA